MVSKYLGRLQVSFGHIDMRPGLLKQPQPKTEPNPKCTRQALWSQVYLELNGECNLQ